MSQQKDHSMEIPLTILIMSVFILGVVVVVTRQDLSFLKEDVRRLEKENWNLTSKIISLECKSRYEK
jgi:hypothetical protein